MKSSVFAFLILLLGYVGPTAADTRVYEISIQNHQFQPSVLVVPAGERFRLIVKNLDATVEEFESYELQREKIVTGNSQITLFIDALDPGEYPFFGEFHMDTALGKIVAE